MTYCEYTQEYICERKEVGKIYSPREETFDTAQEAQERAQELAE